MGVDLEKELVKTSTKDVKQLEKLSGIEDVKLLLSGRSQEEARVLREFNLDTTVQSVEHLRGRTIVLENKKMEYGNAFHREQLKELAVNYDLKLLPLEEYKGGIDTQLGNKIVNFCKEHNLNVDTIRHSNSFYVLAPYEMFNLTASFSERPRRAVDPLLLYKDPLDRDVFTLVHKWGNDFSILRALRGFKYASEEGLKLSLFFESLIFTALAVGLGFALICGHDHFWLPIIVTLIANFIVTSMRYSGVAEAAKHANKGWGAYLTPELWDKNVARVKLKRD